VIDLFSGFGTHDTLQLQLRPTRDDLDTCKARTCMIPFVKEMVPVVDKSAGRVLINPPEGLLDMTSTKSIKVGHTAMLGG
jgi:ribosomal 30S subunit maturation factor RimM